MADEIDLVIAEMRPKRIELADEMADVEHRRIGHVIRVACAELIVSHDRPLAAERFERLHVIAGKAGPAVKKDRRRSLAAAGDFVPDAAAVDREIGLTGSQDLRGR